MADELFTVEKSIIAAKHDLFHNEVITGKTGGVSAGADIDYATNQVTWQVQKTLPKVLRELGMMVQTWTATTGGTLTDASQVFLDDITASTGKGNYYAWTGTFPKVVAPGTDPAAAAGFVMRSDAGLRGELASEAGAGLVGSATYAQIRAYTGNATKINCLGRTGALDKAHGDFYVDLSDTTTPDDDGIILVDALGRRWKRRFIGRVLPEWWGASANTAVDSASALQKAFDWKYVRLSSGDYKTSIPLYIDSETDIKGPGPAKCSITKTTTTLGSGSNLARSGAVNDSYAVDAVIIMRHADNDYNWSSSISGVKISGVGYNISIGIYAPRTARVRLDDVLIWQCQIGWLTHDSWMANWDKVIADANSQSGTYGWSYAVGFEWRDDSAGTLVTGTSLSARNCWAKDCSDGWKLVGLNYSTLDACGADNLIGGTPYFFKATRIVLNGCGLENIKLASGGHAIYAELSKVTMNSCQGYHVIGAPGAAYFNVTAMSHLVLNTCAFDNFASANGAYNRLVTDGSSIDITSSGVPANGDSFTGSKGNGAYIRETIGGDVAIADARGARYLTSSYNAQNSLNKTGKAVSSAGSTILTLTCNGGGGVERAVAKLKISWSDASYPTGVGYSEVNVVCYQDSGINYRGAISTSVNIGAGNGFTTEPVYTISRSGNTFSVIMTPSGGDVTCSFTVDADYSGITLATP